MTSSHAAQYPTQEHSVPLGLETMTSTLAQNGWKKLVNTVRRGPGVAITSHGAVEIVVISRDRAEELEQTIAQLKATIARLDVEGPAARVEALRQRFKERLEARDEDQMRRAIDAAAEGTTRLDGQLHVDDRY